MVPKWEVNDECPFSSQAFPKHQMNALQPASSLDPPN